MTSPNSIDELNRVAEAIWMAGVSAVNASQQVRQFVKVDQQALYFGDYKIPHSGYRNIFVVGAGKFAGEMAAGLEQALSPVAGRKQISGQVNVPDGRESSLQQIQVIGCRPLGVNLPTERVLQSTGQIMERLKTVHPDDLVITLFTGGGSALLEQPVDSISLTELQAVTTRLSQGGASIEELNRVRSQLSRVKAGGLVRITPCRQIVSLLISDVLGDPIAAIASGPTVPSDSFSTLTERQAALEILARYDSGFSQTPSSVVQFLRSPVEDVLTKRTLPDVKHFVIANNQLAVQAAFEKAKSLGFAGTRETDFSASRVEIVAQGMLNQLKQSIGDSTRGAIRACFISGGEPTVVVGQRPGRGGRNQHLVLSFMKAVLQEQLANSSPDANAFASLLANLRFSFLSAGTDGEDGNVPVAGARVDSEILNELLDSNSEVLNGLLPLTAPGSSRQMDFSEESDSSNVLQLIQHHLEQADSFPLLDQLGCIFRASNTQTNVCDLRVLLWEQDQIGSGHRF